MLFEIFLVMSSKHRIRGEQGLSADEIISASSATLYVSPLATAAGGESNVKNVGSISHHFLFIRDSLAEVEEGLDVHMRSQADAHMEALGLACLLIDKFPLGCSTISSASVLANALRSTDGGIQL